MTITEKPNTSAGRGIHWDVDVEVLGQRRCDQTIAPCMPWRSIDWNNNTICIAAGEHTGKGTLVIPSEASGTAANYKVLP